MTRVAIAGLGAIGRVLARRLHDGIAGSDAGLRRGGRSEPRRRAGLTPKASTARWSRPRNFRRMPISRSNARRPRLERICRPMLEAGKSVMVLSAGALLEQPELIALAKAHGGQILVPTGALLGLDAVAAAAEGRIHSVHMTTRKPPRGLAGAPYLVANKISVEGLTKARQVFRGTAREAAAGFPPTLMSPPRYRSPASGRTAPPSRSGRTRRWSGTATPLRWMPTPPASL